MTKAPGFDKLEIRELIERSMQLRHHIEHAEGVHSPPVPGNRTRAGRQGRIGQARARSIATGTGLLTMSRTGE